MTTAIETKPADTKPAIETKPTVLVSAPVAATKPADAIKAAVTATVAKVEPKVAAPKAPRKPRTPKANAVAAKPVVAPKIIRAAKTAKTPKISKAAKTAAARPVANAAKDAVNDFPAAVQAQFQKIQESWISGATDFGDLNLAGTEIQQVVEASRDAAMKGVNEMKNEIEKFFQESINGSVSSSKELMKAKSLPQLLELQSKHAQSALQAFVEHSRTLAAIASRTSQESFRPFNAGWTDAFGEFYKRASF